MQPNIELTPSGNIFFKLIKGYSEIIVDEIVVKSHME